MRIVFDIETDGLLDTVTRMWCATTYSIETDQLVHYCTEQEVDSFLSVVLNKDNILIGHNICNFDIPFLERHFGYSIGTKRCRDTYVLSKLLYPERGEHSLESWMPKFGFEKKQHEDWSQYSEEMRERNISDVKGNAALYKYFVQECSNWNWGRSLQLEQEMHYWQALQELAGVDLDEEHAYSLLDTLDKRLKEIDQELSPRLPLKISPVGVTVSKPFKKDGDYVKRVYEWFEKPWEEISA